MNRLCYAILLLLLLTSPIAAQDDTAPFPVLDEAAIFADGVTVIERLSLVQPSSENRMLYYFDATTLSWTQFPYPEEATRLIYIETRTNGTYVLNNLADSTGYSVSFNDSWIFNPIAGTISRPELRCGHLAALLDEGEWRLSYSANEGYSLCHTETGAKLFLPETIQSQISCENNLDTSSQSPDSHWVIFYSCVRPFQIFVADTTTGEVKQLGEIGTWGLPSWRWVNNDIAIITMFSQGFNLPLFPTFIAHISQGNLQYIGDVPDFSENRVVWDEVVLNEDNSAQNIIYEFVFNTSEQHELYRYSCDVIEHCLIGGIAAASPSSRYVAIGTESTRNAEWQDRFIVWDTLNQTIIFEPDIFTPLSDLVWINDYQLLAVVEGGLRSTLLLLQVSGHEMTAAVLQNSSWNVFLNLSPNKEAVLLMNEANRDTLLHLPTMRTIEVFREPDAGRLSWERQANDLTLNATIYYDCDLERCEARWRVRVNAAREAEL